MINELKKLFKSFENAYYGIKFCISNERNLRIHLTAVFYVLLFSFLLKISTTEYIILLVCFCQVISCELVNTSIEVLCDKEAHGYNKFIKKAKDIAAAAVLVCAFFSVLVAIIIFTPKLPQLLVLILNFKTLCLILITIPLALFFIFKRRK